MSKNSKNSQNSQKDKTEIALLFLTYENILHRNNPVLQKYLDNTNVYIHPKDPAKITDKYAENIIPIRVETQWAKDNIVIATLSLLREAFSNPHNKWFVLCSEDVFPMKTYEDFSDYLGTQKISVFSTMRGSGLRTGIFKSQQWWALTRTDVELLIFLNSIVNQENICNYSCINTVIVNKRNYIKHKWLHRWHVRVWWHIVTAGFKVKRNSF